MRFSLRLPLLATLVLGSTGCFVVDSKPLDNLADGGGGTDMTAPDLGPDGGTDSGSGDLGMADLGDLGFRIMPIDSCGDPTRGVISMTTPPFGVDTNGMTDDIRATCAGHATMGNDAFFAVSVASGDYWHFHLAVDPRDLAMARDPALYLLQATSGSCDGRTCAQISDQCDGTSDEHFAFTAPSAGTWFLGVDDRNSGGARYVLTAIRPTCGNATGLMPGESSPEHGEACDDGNPINGDGCDSRCRVELTDATEVNERIPNDNQVEANHLLLPATNTLIVTGDIAGDDCYPDVFAVDIMAGQHLNVVALNASEGACVTPGTNYALELRNAANTRITGTVDAMGCPIIDRTGLAAGQYFIWLKANNYHDADTTYHLRVTVS